jgi:hypothetical protein
MAKERPIDPGCTDPVPPETCQVQVPSPYRRLADPCGTVALPDPCVIDPTKFSAAEDAPEPAAVEIPALPVITLLNVGVTSQCSDLPSAGIGIVGDAITVAGGALRRDIPLSSVSGITLNQRQTIAALSAEAIAELPSFSALLIAEVTSLTLEQATSLHNELESTQDALDSQAYDLALSRLECFYPNTRQEALCTGNADAGVISYVIDAGTLSSPLSQEAANTEALALATSQLQCLWYNDQVTEVCASTGAIVWTYTVTARTLTSAISRADANAQAAASALSLLDCRYPNAQQQRTCDNIGKTQTDPLAGTNSVTVAAGTFLSEISVADANAQAVVYAEAGLSCQWSNAAVEVVCPADSGHAASITASPTYKVTIAARTFFSEVGQVDADEQATGYGALQLECRYCNTLVPALCAGGSSEDETASVPANTFCDLTFSGAQELAEALAAIPVKLQVTGTPTCRYFNDRKSAVCVEPSPNTAGHLFKFSVAAGTGLSTNSSTLVIIEAGSVVSTTSKADANTQAEALALSFLDCFFDSEAKQFACALGVSVNSTPPFTLSAGTFRSYTSRTEANSLRDAYGNAALDCFYDSAEATFSCALGTSPNSTPSFKLLVGHFRSYANQTSADGLRDAYGNSILDCFYDSTERTFSCAEGTSPNSTTPFTLLEGQFTSATSVNDANALRDAYGDSLLDCFYDSTERTFSCASGTSPNSTKPFTLPAGQFTSATGVNDADDLRDAYGTSLLDCFYDSTSRTFSCALGTSTNATRPFTLLAGQFTSATSVTDADALRDAYGNSLLDCFYDSEVSDPIVCPSGVSTGSYPAPGSPVILPAGFFTSTTSVAIANNLRDAYASTITYCFWRNVEKSADCDAGAMAPASSVVGAGTLVSFLGQTDADELAQALATAGRRCLYANVAKSGGNCPAGTTKLQSGSVSAGTIVADTQVAADSLAQTLANSLNVCASDSVLATAVTPGSQGPSGNCTNPCGAFYS